MKGDGTPLCFKPAAFGIEVFERAMLRERIRNGLEAARKQGRIGGRRPKLKEDQKKEIVDLVNSGKKNAAEAARLFGVHPSTVSRLLQSTVEIP